jgi:NADPH:quinone reductase-like Zn-dependent oxidoreductase
LALEIVSPGGVEQLRLIPVPPGATTTGYNVARRTKLLFSTSRKDIVKVNVSHFSVNFADICIRQGLYESAIRNVGYPIVPGFDISGVVSSVPPGCKDFKVGDEVYGATLFGGYSQVVGVPANQLRKIPKGVTPAGAASLPAVSLTAIHALVIAGFPPLGMSKMKLGTNRTVLVHSASGGVGGMLVQFAKKCGAERVVGVVGRTEKVEYCKGLGCDVVVCKEGKSKTEWWKEVEEGNEGRGFQAGGLGERGAKRRENTNRGKGWS